MKLDKKVALITGGGGAFGRAMALLFAREGADIAVSDINYISAEETVTLIKQLDRKAIAIKVNVAKANDVDIMVDRVINELGGIHILVNCAGISPSGGPTIEQSIENWDEVIATHLRGTYLCCRRAGQWMVAHQTGKILNISSTAGISGAPMITSYGASKAGIINMTRCLAVEWGKYNVNVNCLAPGWVITPMTEEAIKAGRISADAIKQRTPLGRIGTPEDIAHTALFLVSEDARHITGVTLPVDGGWLAFGYQAL